MDTAALLTLARQPLAGAALAAGTFAAGLAAYSVARAPARAVTKLGPRGLKRQHALRDGDWFPMVEPLLRWCATRLDGVLPESIYRTLDRRLTRAGDYLGATPDEYVLILASGALLGFSAGAWHSRAFDYGAFSFVVGTFLGTFVAQRIFDAQIQRRAREITHGLPYVTDLLALAMTAGLDFPGAVKNVLERSSNKKDALTEELERVLQELALGHTRKYALEQLAERTQVPAAIEFVYAVTQAEERGSPLADVLAIQATVARQKRSALAEESANRAQQLMIVPLMLLLVAALLLLAAPMVITILDTFEKFL
jgi:tight adherence protein C